MASGFGDEQGAEGPQSFIRTSSFKDPRNSVQGLGFRVHKSLEGSCERASARRVKEYATILFVQECPQVVPVNGLDTAPV